MKKLAWSAAILLAASTAQAQPPAAPAPTPQAPALHEKPKVLIGPRLPSFSAIDTEGNILSSDEILGPDSFLPPEERKTLMLILFKIPCEACVEEIPEIKKLREEYKGKNVEFLYLNTYNTPKAVRQFAAKHKLDFKLLLDEEGTLFEQLLETYKFRTAFPVSLVFASDGHLINKVLVGLTPLDMVRTSLNAALAHKPD